MAICIVWTALSVVVATTSATELVPERFLRPRDFNHHPFTDVGSNSAQRAPPSLPDTHPYAILSSKRPREGRQFPEQNIVLYPNPPQEVLPRKQTHHLHQSLVQVQQHLQPEVHQLQQHLQPEVHQVQQHLQQQIQPEVHQVQQPLHQYQAEQAAQPIQTASYDPYNIIPKNYAFSYSVKDRHSGDDFSHSQAHNGKATRGQYRVKLPDGRVQVVSYTADHKGYRADVQYEGAAAPYPQPTPIYENQPEQHVNEQPQYTPTPAPYIHTPTPASYEQQQPSYSPTPATYIQDQSYSPTPPTYNAQQYVSGYGSQTPGYEQAVYNSPTRPPYESQFAPATPSTYEQQYVSPTPSPYQANAYISPTPEGYQSPSYAAGSSGLQAYASPSPTPYDQQYDGPYERSPSPFAVESNLRSSPAPFAKQQESSTIAPDRGQVYVTPRTLFNAALARRGFGSQNSILYKFSSPA